MKTKWSGQHGTTRPRLHIAVTSEKGQLSPFIQPSEGTRTGTVGASKVMRADVGAWSPSESQLISMIFCCTACGGIVGWRCGCVRDVRRHLCNRDEDGSGETRRASSIDASN